MKNYKLSYLPSFREDLDKTVNYITNVLKNPQAAYELVADLEEAIQNRRFMPLSFEATYPKRGGEPFYRIYVKNYIVLYVVIDDVMEVRRLFHGSQDYGRLL